MIDLPVPADRLHLEDLPLGRRVAFGRHTIVADDVSAFARACAPGDAPAAPDGALSPLDAALLLMRMLAEELLNRSTSLGAPGIEALDPVAPLRVGDAISARIEWTARRPLASRPGVGIAATTLELLGPGSQVALRWRANQLLRVRDPAAWPVTTEAAPARRPAPPPASLWDAAAPQGAVHALGEHGFEEAAIVRFARTYDPQPFHLDAQAARASLFGGLCASGWHTVATLVRLLEASPLAGGRRLAGLRGLRWLKPVFPGDRVAFRGVSDGTSDGVALVQAQGRDQDGALVLSAGCLLR